jgi:hypothetical protein
LMRLSKLLIPLLDAKMLQILLEDSWPENNNTVHFSLTLLRVTETSINSKKKMITWVKDFMTLELNLKLLKMMVSKMPKLNSKIKISSKWELIFLANVKNINFFKRNSRKLTLLMIKSLGGPRNAMGNSLLWQMTKISQLLQTIS